MKLDRKTERGIQKVEEKIYEKTNVNNTRFRQNKNESKCIGLCNKDNIYGVYKQMLETSDILVKIFK